MHEPVVREYGWLTVGPWPSSQQVMLCETPCQRPSLGSVLVSIQTESSCLLLSQAPLSLPVCRLLQCRIIRGTELAAAEERLESLRKRERELLDKCSVDSLLEKLKSETQHVAIV